MYLYFFFFFIFLNISSYFFIFSFPCTFTTHLIHVFPLKVDAVPGVNDRARLKMRIFTTFLGMLSSAGTAIVFAQLQNCLLSSNIILQKVASSKYFKSYSEATSWPKICNI